MWRKENTNKKQCYDNEMITGLNQKMMSMNRSLFWIIEKRD